MREGEYSGTDVDRNSQILFLQQLLREFKDDLLVEITELISKRNNISEKKYMKSKEVQRILEISPGTLQTRRNSGEIPFTKIGGCIYYDRDEIQKVFENNKVIRK